MGTPSLSLCDFRSRKVGFSWLARFASWNFSALLLAFLLTGRGQAQNAPAQEQGPPPAAGAQAGPVGAVVEPHGVKQAKASPKYDVNHIGERGIGTGVNFYSLERERRLGEVMARGIDLHTKFENCPQLRLFGSIHHQGDRLTGHPGIQLAGRIFVCGQRIDSGVGHRGGIGGHDGT